MSNQKQSINYNTNRGGIYIKQEVIAYLSALINGYERKVNREDTSTLEREELKHVVADLGDFLDYIIDTKKNIKATPTESLELNAKLIEDIRLLKKSLSMKDTEIASLKVRNTQLHELWYKQQIGL